ncbi:MAG: hypothetical protein HYT37_00395 [Candidatus Sungbacteria bacterium]|nr:hypothetical protein [Candidatus Sungbacteria bacterium]
MNKWKQVGAAAEVARPYGSSFSSRDNVGKRGYALRRAGNVGSGTFTPKKAVRSFRDLEVYQKTLECSVLIGKNVMPALAKLKFPFAEGMTNCSLSIPLYIAEAHSLRFSDFTAAMATLEKAMAGCNKMIVYMEESLGLYGEKLDGKLIQDLSLRYINVRGKMLRLLRSWQKYRRLDDNQRGE